MEQVSLVISQLFDIEYKIPNIENIIQMIERLAEKKAKSLKKAYQKQMDDTVLDLAIRLDEILDYDDVQPKVTKLVTRKIDTTNDKLDETGVHSIKQDFGMSKTKKRKNNAWTPETKEQFLNDVPILSYEELAQKYHLSLSSVKKYIQKMQHEVMK